MLPNMSLLRVWHWYDKVRSIVARGHRENVRGHHTGLEADGKADLDEGLGVGGEAG